MRASTYNFYVPVAHGALLYNTLSGRLIRFGSGDGEQLASLLASAPSPLVDPTTFSEEVTRVLRDGGFVVDDDFDEVAIVRRRYWAARRDGPIVLTVTVTQDCNLKCFYCYEPRTEDWLAPADVDAVIARLEESVRANSRRAVHVDWYGGEPLLNASFIDHASDRLQAYARERDLGYTASIISNGTGWPEDPVAFVRRNAIREAQISFDGPQAQHERYRVARDRSQTGTFGEAVRVVDALLGHCKLSVRLNLDRRTEPHAEEFLDFARRRGWFAPGTRSVFQPARLAAFSERSGFMQEVQLSVTEFEEIKARLRQATGCAVPTEEAETIDGFPRPKTSVCAALGLGSLVVGANMMEYRCGLQVGEPGRAVADLRALTGLADGSRAETSPANALVTRGNDQPWWDAFDPTEQPRCARCSFLPVCWGGCPKRHLEGDGFALDEQGRYWRENLARLVADGAGETLRHPWVYTEDDQLRSA